jgi:hypothetical protein
MLLISALFIGACGDDTEPICEAQTYRCGGAEGTIVERCDSRGLRWETLTDCSEFDEICVDGECLESLD